MTRFDNPMAAYGIFFVFGGGAVGGVVFASWGTRSGVVLE